MKKIVTLIFIFILSFTYVFSSEVPHVYIDPGISSFPTVDVDDEDVLHIFSHGRSGELLLEGEWLVAEQIAEFILGMTAIDRYRHINIYGCGFAKGDKGYKAVKKLEKLLQKSVSASDDITGIDGDWHLEVGPTISPLMIPDFKGNLQFGPTDDFDGDGIANQDDSDDDNDGVLDSEETTCAQGSISNSGVTATTEIGHSGDPAVLVNGVQTEATFILNSEDITGKEVLKFELGTPQNLSSIEIGVTASTVSFFFAGAEVKVQGSQDDINWIDLTNTLTMDGTADELVDHNNGGAELFELARVSDYKYYRILGVSGFSRNAVYLEEAYFKGGACTDIDSDNDSISNRFDTDSDNDGCSDAYEAGASNNTTPDYTFPASSVGANGFSDFIETTPESNAFAGGYTYSNAIDGTPCTIPVCTDPTNMSLFCDYDGDGILNKDDADDDNDGILDIVECPKPDVVVNGHFDDAKSSWSGNGFYDSRSNSPFRGGLYTGIIGQDDNPNGALQQASDNIVDGVYQVLNLDAKADTLYPYTFDLGVWAGIASDLAEYSIEIRDENQNPLSPPLILEVGNFVTDIENHPASKPGLGSIETVYRSFNGTFTVPVDGTYSIFVRAAGDGNQPFDYFIDRVAIEGNECTGDNDNDGLTNKFDLDSDNDNCGDFIEGGGNFTNANGETAGGSASGGTGSSVTKNMCTDFTCVDGFGIPISTTGSTPQGIGTSQDNAALSPNCCPVTETPMIDGAMPTAFCGQATVDLTSFITNSDPNGRLAVFTTDMPSGIGEEIDGTMAPNPGTYYFFFYNAASDCFGPVSAPLSITNETSPNAGTDAVKTGCSVAANGITTFDLDDELMGEDTGGTWTAGSGPTIGAGNVVDFTGSPDGAYVYTYTVTGSSPCVDDQSTVTFNITTCACPDADNDGTCDADELPGEENDPCKPDPMAIPGGDCDGDGTPNGSDPNPTDPCVDDGTTGDEDTSNAVWQAADCDGDGTPNGTPDPAPYDPCVGGMPGSEDPNNAIWQAADCDGDGTPNGSDPNPTDPCVDDGTTGDEDTSNAVWQAADCDGDGTPNGSDPNPTDPCVDDGTTGDEDTSNAVWQAADCDGDGTPNGTPDPAPYDPCVGGMPGSEDPNNAIWQAADCDGDGTPNGSDPNPTDPCVDDGTTGDEDTSNAVWQAADCDGDGTPNGSDPNPTDPCVDDGTTGDEDTSNAVWQAADCDGDGTPNGTPDPAPYDPCVGGMPGSEDPNNAIWQAADCDGDGTPNGSDPNPTDPCVDDGTTGDEDTSNAVWQAADCDGDGTPNGSDPNPTDPCIDDGTTGDEDTSNAVWQAADCDGDGTPNGTPDPAPYDPCVGGMPGSEDPNNAIWQAADCDGDGDPNGTDIDPQNPCEYSASQNVSNADSAWNSADCDGDGVTNADETNGGTDANDPCDNPYTTAAEVCAAITNGATGLASSDCDNGGVSDGQECANGTDPLDSSDDNNCPIADDNADCDGDGVTNGQERTDGTDPLDACSMNIASVTLTATNTGDCDGDGVTNADETNGPDGVVGGGDGTDANDACDFNTSQVTLTATSTGDCDGDGVTNADETNGPDGVVGGGDGTDANDACDFNTSQVTLTATSTGDCDGDGVTNADETNGPDGVVGGGDGTDANDPCDNPYTTAAEVCAAILNGATGLASSDCDNGGVSDGQECANGTDPLDSSDDSNCPIADDNADCDGDGVTNGQERTDGTDPLDACSMNIASVTLTATNTGDCDGDGVTNADETNGPDGVVGGGDGTDANDACDFNTSQVTLTATNTGDCDGDGVTNADETNGPDGVVGGGDGTDANDACDFNTSQVTLTATSTGDCDGDGVTNADETNGPDGVVGGGDGTDANDPCDNPYTTAAEVCAAITNGATGLASSDCDNGGVSDGQECANGTDPLDSSDDSNCPIADDNADCDGDGVTNGQERTDGTDPLDACSMNIASVTLTATNTGDCDGDGVTNADETNGPDGVVGGGDGTDANDACDFNTSQVTLTATSTGDCDGDGVTNADETNGPDGVVGGGDGTDANDACDFNTSQVTLTATNTGDCDGDGVTNADETNGPDGVVGGGDGTDANDACDFNTSQVTLTATSTGDCDGDGVTNADETNGPDGVVGGGDGTDANDACDFNTSQVTLTATSTGDCDGDGVTNADETNGPDGVVGGGDGTDANDACDFNTSQVTLTATSTGDCDGDGVTNADETNGPDGVVGGGDGTDANDACDFNTSQVTLTATSTGDCDGDGVTNADETNGPDGVVGGGDGTDANDACDFNTSQVTLAQTGEYLSADCDGDGATNEEEINNGTPTDSPNAADDTTTTGPGETVTINILENDDYLPNDANTIEMIGGNAQGTVSFNTTTGTLVYTPTASESGSEVTITYEVCQDNVCTTADVFINVGALAPTCPINTAVFLEGSLIIPGFNSYTNEMRSTINSFGLLPGQTTVTGFAIPTEMGQPYDGSIWGYTGAEGNNYSTYANDVVDWVLVDVRKGESTDGTLADSIDFSNTICRNAGFLHEDGRITFKDDICECPISDGDEVFIVLHHRNHLPIVSELTTVVQSTASFDFRNRQSLSVDFNRGQKRVKNNIYAMYGGNGETGVSEYNDINASDISRWINENSYNDIYIQADYDMNTDVNSNDKLLLILNSGISSQIVN